MSTYYLLEVASDGTPSVSELSDPVTVTESISVPLASLFPPAPAPAAPADSSSSGSSSGS